MIIAGEASGDLHGANLVRALKQKNKRILFYGIGGHAMRNAGVNIFIDSSSLAVVGISEVFPKLKSILKGMAAAKNMLRNQSPDLLILIDFPDFNLHIAGCAKRLGIPVLYYISPQIWAWRKSRVHKIKKLVDHMAVILPFEEAFYRKYKVPVTFVGHPLLDLTHPPAPLSFPKRGGLGGEFGVEFIGLLPGSRDGEIGRHLPVMLKAASKLRQQRKNIRFILSVSPSADRKQIDKIIKQSGFSELELTQGVYPVFEKADLVIAVSGTVTLEAAICGIPMIIIYKVSPLSYWIGRALIQVNAISLVNLIFGRQIVPELIQNAASPESIADMAIKMLNDKTGLEKIKTELLAVRNMLGGKGASERVAEIVCSML